ncbi:membrane protein [Bacteroidia bacterium]|nr:membrane protein [Bacteroidia bacterium]
MKNINKFCTLHFALCAIITLTSCNKLLDVIPESDITDKSYFTNADEVNSGVVGCYSGMLKTIATEWMFTELRSDNSYQREANSSTQSNIDLNDLDMFRPLTYMSGIYNYWYATYQNIATCNIVMEHLDVVDNAEKQAQYEGECRFIRAYHYFNLVRLFGPVFLCDHTISPQEAKKMNRRPVEEVYQLIIDDLTFASTLPTEYGTNEKGRATQWAAKALLAKVYMTLQDFASAKTLLTDVSNNSGHNTLTNYADVFAVNNELNIEIIFAIRHKAGGFGLGCSWSNDFAPLNSQTAVVLGNGKGLNSPTLDLRNSYDPSDLRKNVNIGVWLNSAQVEYLYPKKLVVPVEMVNDSDLDFPVLRFADVLLMLAECENELVGPATALSILDPIRQRAGLANLASASQMEARLLIENERRFELAFENQRFFDLQRTGRLKEVMENEIFVMDWVDHYSKYPTDKQPVQGQIVQEWQYLLPIPGLEIDANNDIVITQNFGY